MDSVEAIISRGKNTLEEGKLEEAFDLFRYALADYPADMTILGYSDLIECLLLHQYCSVFPSLQVVPKINPTISDKLTQLNLQGHEGFLLTQIDSSTTIKSLIYIGGLGKFRTLRIINKFLHEGIIVV